MINKQKKLLIDKLALITWSDTFAIQKVKTVIKKIN